MRFEFWLTTYFSLQPSVEPRLEGMDQKTRVHNTRSEERARSTNEGGRRGRERTKRGRRGRRKAGGRQDGKERCTHQKDQAMDRTREGDLWPRTSSSTTPSSGLTPSIAFFVHWLISSTSHLELAYVIPAFGFERGLLHYLIATLSQISWKTLFGDLLDTQLCTAFSLATQSEHFWQWHWSYLYSALLPAYRHLYDFNQNRSVYILSR